MTRLVSDDPIVRLDPSALDGLLVEVVNDGASIGFLAPLDPAEALAWWSARAADPRRAHRAELVKLMVAKDARGRGLARRLLGVAEEAAVAAGVTLLHLDTETGSPAERLYEGAGWTRVGVIPDYAADPGGVLRPTTLYYKRVGVLEG
ncbi:GNAT family N-acetyltransferase [Streptomyces acidiscabies]|uniref:GNAT family N-acetyltransferase n=1 Tax=Streptomyces acidiscabies TaxID=42234 RepID=UPI0038F70B01